ncbi:hypothetical protein FA15DRAFT_695462 [Coprinopsis marcescibilis]|uniref:Uncharacterized protein n=1 Tax=Coprinopsis marcescibilis TaxID=230819 RepID=A0A5C3KRJ6_COPMA|nr:hypothetical protein FA15DRAFT_695462 [Coprinopsis marcescibilis]
MSVERYDHKLCLIHQLPIRRTFLEESSRRPFFPKIQRDKFSETDLFLFRKMCFQNRQRTLSLACLVTRSNFNTFCRSLELNTMSRTGRTYSTREEMVASLQQELADRQRTLQNLDTNHNDQNTPQPQQLAVDETDQKADGSEQPSATTPEESQKESRAHEYYKDNGKAQADDISAADAVEDNVPQADQPKIDVATDNQASSDAPSLKNGQLEEHLDSLVPQVKLSAVDGPEDIVKTGGQTAPANVVGEALELEPDATGVQLSPHFATLLVYVATTLIPLTYSLGRSSEGYVFSEVLAAATSDLAPPTKRMRTDSYGGGNSDKLIALPSPENCEALRRDLTAHAEDCEAAAANRAAHEEEDGTQRVDAASDVSSTAPPESNTNDGNTPPLHPKQELPHPDGYNASLAPDVYDASGLAPDVYTAYTFIPSHHEVYAFMPFNWNSIIPPPLYWRDNRGNFLEIHPTEFAVAPAPNWQNSAGPLLSSTNDAGNAQHFNPDQVPGGYGLNGNEATGLAPLSQIDRSLPECIPLPWEVIGVVYPNRPPLLFWRDRMGLRVQIWPTHVLYNQDLNGHNDVHGSQANGPPPLPQNNEISNNLNQPMGGLAFDGSQAAGRYTMPYPNNTGNVQALSLAQPQAEPVSEGIDMRVVREADAAFRSALEAGYMPSIPQSGKRKQDDYFIGQEDTQPAQGSSNINPVYMCGWADIETEKNQNWLVYKCHRKFDTKKDAVTHIINEHMGPEYSRATQMGISLPGGLSACRVVCTFRGCKNPNNTYNTMVHQRQERGPKGDCHIAKHLVESYGDIATPSSPTRVATKLLTYLEAKKERKPRQGKGKGKESSASTSTSTSTNGETTG